MSEKIYNFCPYCGKKLPKSKNYKTYYCCFCGKKFQSTRKNLMKKVHCIICHNIVDQNRHKTLICSYCGGVYHSTCVSSWLQKYNACPMCQNVFLFPNQIIATR